MHLKGTGERGMNSHVAVVLGADADESYSATYDALWLVLGDYWFGLGNNRCIIQETSKRQTLTLEQATPYSLRVSYCGAEAEYARWQIDLTHEKADGFGGYDVQSVGSETGHTADALNERLITFVMLASRGVASILREH